MLVTARTGLLIAAALAAAGCGSAKRTVPSNAAAIVGEQAITKAALNHALSRGICRSGGDYRRSFGACTRRQTLQVLVQRAEREQKARELGIEVSDEDVEERIEQLTKRYLGGSEKRYREQLRQQRLSEEQVKADVRAQLVEERTYSEVTKGLPRERRQAAMIAWKKNVHEEFSRKTWYQPGLAPR